MEAVGSSSICQGSQEECHPPECQVIGIQVSFPAIGPTVDHEPAQLRFRGPEKHCPRQSLMGQRLFVEVLGKQEKFPEKRAFVTVEMGRSSTGLEEHNNTNKNMHWGEYEEQISYPHHLFPKAAQLWAKRDLSPRFLYRGKRPYEVTLSCLSSLSGFQRAHSVFSHPEYLLTNCMTGG